MKTYAIHWKSAVSGRIGTGTKLFEKDEAERLAIELNEEYPDIEHDAATLVSTIAEPALAEAASHAFGSGRLARAPDLG